MVRKRFQEAKTGTKMPSIFYFILTAVQLFDEMLEKKEENKRVECFQALNVLNR